MVYTTDMFYICFYSRAKKSNNSLKEPEESVMHDIDKPITLEDLTNPDKD